MANITVAGVWHQGMVLSACFADLGHEVVGICSGDRDAATLNAGTPLLHEPGLGPLLETGINAGRLRFTTDARAAVQNADIVFISNDTAVDDDDASDLTDIFGLADTFRVSWRTRPMLCVT